MGAVLESEGTLRPFSLDVSGANATGHNQWQVINSQFCARHSNGE
jgi:hypothetical protein